VGISAESLAGVRVEYKRFEIPKKSGGTREITAPTDELKAVQRRVLSRVLGRLRAHACATGFERGHSIVTHARAHVGQDVVIKLDIRDFFSNTKAKRVEAYFRRIGWDAEAARALTRLTTYEGKLPQGAPTSPRLSNLVNHRLDARLAGLARACGMAYSRYADDITFSGPAWRPSKEANAKVAHANDVIHATKVILELEGYALHTEKKLRLARRHDRQLVTGLVVNRTVNIPRKTRRRLRAVEHHLKTGRPATMTPEQLEGWKALAQMVASQRETAS
jgi:RNA-directed DNA polymerase